MSTCTLCRAHPTDRRHDGVDLCDRCASADPTPALLGHGIAAAFELSMGRFSAELHLPGVHPELQFHCVPETWSHKLAKLAFPELQVGDPAFDRAIYVRSARADLAAPVLAREAVQAGILTQLTAVWHESILGNHVEVDQRQLRIRTAPRPSHESDPLTELSVAAATLALALST